MAEAVVTKLARNKMLKARAGDLALPKIVGMAFGSGGVDPQGIVIIPSDTQNALNTELLRKEIDSKTYVSDVECKYEVTLETEDLPGQSISEIALYDEVGDLVAIKNFLPKKKDSDLEMIFQISDMF